MTEMDQEWIKIMRPGKFVAKISFPNEQDLKAKRKELFSRAAAVCNILDLRAHTKSNPPCINISVEREEEVQKLKETLKDFEVSKEEKLAIDDSRKVILIANSPRCDIASIRKRMNDYGSLIYSASYNVQNSSKKNFTVAFDDATVAESLLKQRYLFIGQDLVVVKKPEVQEKRGSTTELVMKLSNLPYATTDWQLKEIMAQLKASSWRVPVSRNFKCIPICYVCFENEDDLFFATAKKLKLRGNELLWSKPQEKVCDRCLSTEHEYKACRTYKPYTMAKPSGRFIPEALASLSDPKIRYSDIARGQSETLQAKEEELLRLRDLNDQMEKEIERSIRLKELKRQLDEEDNPKVSYSPPEIQQQNARELWEKINNLESKFDSKFQSIEELMHSVIEKMNTTPDVAMTVSDDAIGEKLSTLDKTVRALKKSTKLAAGVATARQRALALRK